MADLVAENDLNVLFADVNNNVADHNTGINNTGPTGLNTGNNDDTDNNNYRDANIPGPSEYRDRLTASSSSLSQRLEDDHRPPQNYQPNQLQGVLIPVGTDATTRALFTVINQTNYLIFLQGERLRVLKDSRRAPRRHMRHDSPPPHQIEDRPQSPPWRRRRDASRSPSPQRTG